MLKIELCCILISMATVWQGRLSFMEITICTTQIRLDCFRLFFRRWSQKFSATIEVNLASTVTDTKKAQAVFPFGDY